MVLAFRPYFYFLCASRRLKQASLDPFTPQYAFINYVSINDVYLLSGEATI